MSSRLEKLLFSVSLIDQVTGPANAITARLDTLFQHAKQGMAQVAAGGVGLVSVGYSLRSLLSPAIEMDRALGELRSLDVSDSALQQLERTALRTSVRYGDSAADIVRSSYDIQSAIAGLTDNELSRFTQASAVLAKGTKADAATITDYMGTMYGIFQQSADAMGKAQWVEQLTGQTASAVKMFKTTGAEMASSFGALGAQAQSQGVLMAEQIAILGTLQATMSGSEAGTKYRAFLANIGKAQETLGLQFTDSHGRLLPMIDILQTLRADMGEIDTVAKMDALKEAFGSKEAVALIQLLMQNTDGLAGSIDQLSNVKGMDTAIKMAEAIADPWQRANAAGVAARTTFGKVLMPVLLPLIDTFIDGTQTVMRWTELFPNLTRVVGIASLGIFALIATVSLFAVVGGVAQLTMAGFSAVMLLGTGIVRGFSLVLRLATTAMAVMRAIALAGAIQIGLFSSALSISTAATWLFSAALWANPITWVVMAVVALIAGLVLLVMHWDEVKVAVVGFVNSAFGWLIQTWQYLRGLIEGNGFLRAAFAPLLLGVDIAQQLLSAFANIPKWWQQFKQWLTQLDVFAVLGDGIDWVIKKINAIPGIEIEASSLLADKVNEEKESIAQALPSLTAPRIDAVPVGGLQSSLTNNNQRATHVEKIEVHTTGGVDGFRLADELALAAI